MTRAVFLKKGGDTEAMNLNLGCGSCVWDGWVNCDSHLPSSNGSKYPDVLADAQALPFQEDSFDNVAMIHVLEHVYPQRLSLVLQEIRRILRQGGRLILEGPDILRCFELYKSDLRMLNRGLYGEAMVDRLEDLHKYGWTAQAVARRLQNAGFVVASVGKGNSHGYPDRDYQVIGIKA